MTDALRKDREQCATNCPMRVTGAGKGECATTNVAGSHGLDVVAATPACSARRSENKTRDITARIDTAARVCGICHLYPGGDGGSEGHALQYDQAMEAPKTDARIRRQHRTRTRDRDNTRPGNVHSPTELLVEISGKEGDNRVLCKTVAAHDEGR